MTSLAFDISLHAHFAQEIDSLNKVQIQKISRFPQGQLPPLIGFSHINFEAHSG